MAAPPLWGLKERPHKRPGQGRQRQEAAPPGEGALAWSGFQAAQREGGLGPGRAAAWEGCGCCHRHARWSGQGCRDAAPRARGRAPGLLRPPEPGQAWRPWWRRCVATRDTCWTSLRTQSPRHKQLVPRRGCEGPAEGTARQGPEGSPSRRPLRTCTSVPHLRGTGRVEPTRGRGRGVAGRRRLWRDPERSPGRLGRGSRAVPSASTVLLGSRSSVTRPPPDTKPGQGRQRRKPQVSRGEATGPGSGRLQARGAAQDPGPPGTVPVCRRAGGTGHRRWASPHTVPCWLRPASQAAVTGASVGPAPRVWPLCRHCVPRWRPPVQTVGRPSCTL